MLGSIPINGKARDYYQQLIPAYWFTVYRLPGEAVVVDVVVEESCSCIQWS